MINNFIRKYPILIMIMVLAFLIRLIAGYTQSFSNDELSALYRLQFDRFSDLLHWGIKMDGHPALVQIFLYYYTPLIPKGELYVRIPFVMASTLSLGFIFFSLKKLSGEFTAYLVVIILAFSGFSVQLGYFARPYAFGILFTSAATYYWIRIFIDQSVQKKYLIAFILFSIVAAYTHYFALLEILVLGLATFIFSPVRYWWKIIVSGSIILLAFIPHYFITSFQMSVGGIGGWLGKPKDYFIIDLVLTYFDRSPWIIAGFLGVPMLFIIANHSRPVFRKTMLMVFLSIFPFLVLYVYSIKINSVLQFSACFFLMPFLLGSFFSLFETTAEKPTYLKWSYISLIVLFLSSTLYSNNVFAPIHFGEFKRIAKFIEDHESDSVTTVVAVNNPFYINYYLKTKKPDLYITDMGDNLNFLKRYIDTCNTPQFIYAFANQRSNGEIPFMVQHQFSVLKEKKEFVNSGLYHFNNTQFSAHVKVEPLMAYSYQYAPTKIDSQMFNASNGKFVEGVSYSEFMMDSTMEFSPTLVLGMDSLNLPRNSQVLISAYFNRMPTCDIELVLSIEAESKTLFWRSRKLSYQYGVVMVPGIDSIKVAANTSLMRPSLLALVESMDQAEVDLKHAILKAYIWNPGRCNCWVDGFYISFLAGNKLTTGYSQ